jgi:hypothetical protein
MAMSEYKVIPFRNRDQPETWEAALNEAAGEGWTVVSTGARGDMAFAVMRKEVRGKPGARHGEH